MSQMRFVLSFLAFAISLALLGGLAGMFGISLRLAVRLVSRLLGLSAM